MKILGLIVEYNPLHNGHMYHMTESKKIVNPDLTIAVMSGHFMQRGEPACTTKWNRTDMAIASGIDLVVELPYAYSNQSADLFAMGAVSILKHLLATHLVFGSELGDINELTELAEVMDCPDVQKTVKMGLGTGLSLPSAYGQANLKLTGPNNTLGIQYLRAIKKLATSLKPLTITRHASNYNDQLPTDDNITSATAIRKMINAQADYSSYVPLSIKDAHMKVQNWKWHYKFLRHKLLTVSPDELENIHDMVEGIEHRLIAAALTCSSFADFLQTVGTKRYTKTRIQRICANILTGMTKQHVESWNLQEGAPYVRILGFNEKGAAHLRHIKKDINVPIYSTFGKHMHPMLKHEQKVTAAYASVYDAKYATEIMKKEYANRPIIKVEKEGL